MFCSECGKPVHGKFCSNCGTSLAVHQPGAVEPVPAEVDPDWDCEVRYDTILKFPGVRELIERHGRQAAKKISGEDWLAMADKVMQPVVPLGKLAVVTQPLFGRMGIKMSKQRTQQVSAPVGRVIVRTLCSLAHNNQTLRNVTQGTDGCYFEAALPSDLFSFEGTLLVGVTRRDSQAEVSAATRIDGQMFDWGKSNRCLEQLFTDLSREAA